MGLSSDLISQFVKTTKDTEKTKSESTVLGTTVVYNGQTYVKLDGSDLLTPVNTTADVKSDERVTVLIKNHTATITGNMTSPAARTDDLKETNGKISEFENVVAYSVTTEDLEAVNATIESLRAKAASIDKLTAVEADIIALEAKFANIGQLTTEDLKAVNATIERLEATFGEFDDLEVGDLEAVNADIAKLHGYTADFTYLSANIFNAIRAEVKDLSVGNLDAIYANIDFSNIGEAAIEQLYAKSGIIQNLVSDNGTFTGELVGVTIKGDLIEGGTVKADKLVVKGTDGIYYKLNFEGGNFTEGERVPNDGLHGSVIVANTITAEKINVSDLVAFDATIGGFEITDNSIHSAVKESINNTTQGVYMDSEGQFAVGDGNNFIKYYKDETDGTYKLDISSSGVNLFVENAKTQEDLGKLKDIAMHFRFDENGQYIGKEGSETQTHFTNGLWEFLINGIQQLYVNPNGVYGRQLHTDSLHIGDLIFQEQEDGSIIIS